MKKRLQKKLAKKSGTYALYKEARAKKWFLRVQKLVCKVFKVTYTPEILSTLVYRDNPFRALVAKEEQQ